MNDFKKKNTFFATKLSYLYTDKKYITIYTAFVVFIFL